MKLVSTFSFVYDKNTKGSIKKVPITNEINLLKVHKFELGKVHINLKE